MKVKVVIDVEMCRVPSGVSSYPYKNEIIQIGAVKMNEAYEILDSFSTYVTPRYGRISRFITQLTGISEKTIKDSPDIEKALQQMIQWIGENEVEFYAWSDSDYCQIQKEIRAKCHESSAWEMLLDKGNWIDYQKKLGNRLEASKLLKLSEALQLAEIDVEGQLHNGLHDAYNTACMIAKLETMKDYRTIIERIREKEKEQQPLTISFASFMQGITLETA